MQAHMTAGRSPSLEEQVAVMEQYAETGVEVALTELDVRINLPVNETNLQQQKQAYHDVSGRPLFTPFSTCAATQN